MKQLMVVVLLWIFVPSVLFGVTNEVDYSTCPVWQGRIPPRTEDAKIVLQRFQEERNCNVVSIGGTNAEWRTGEGKSVWVLLGTPLLPGDKYLKFDAEGRLVATGSRFENTTEFRVVEEKYIDELREKWAKEHGMTVEEVRVGCLKWREAREGRRKEKIEMRNWGMRTQPEREERVKKEAAEREKYGPLINAFLKEYLAVQFGDSAENFSPQMSSSFGECPLVKKLWYFKHARLDFVEGKLCHVVFKAEIDDRYSEESCDSNFTKVRAQVLDAVCQGEDGVGKAAAAGYLVECRKEAMRQRAYLLIFRDQKMEAEVKKAARMKMENDWKDARKKMEAERKAEEGKKRARGEVLPEIK